MKKRILFVDDEPGDLQGLRRMLQNTYSRCEVEFASSGPEALDLLKKSCFDVVVSDMRMPEMDGIRLLKRIKEQHPQIIRIILSDHSDEECAIQSVELAHQVLSKPCDAKTLRSTIARACMMRDLLEDQALIKIISEIDSLPSLPSLYKDVIDEVNSEKGSLAKVAEIISQDIGMSAKLLQLVNSAYFGFPARVSSVMRAVNLLGLDTIKALILTVKVFSGFDKAGSHCYSVSSLWEHSISTGITARSFATQEDLEQNLIDEAFMAGLLHDVGKLILLDKLPERCREICDLSKGSGLQLWEAENAVLGTTHAGIGAYLMGIWGFSESIVEAIAFHHTPGTCPNNSFGILTAVHLANSIEHFGQNGTSTEKLDLPYLEKLGIADIFRNRQ